MNDFKRVPNSGRQDEDRIDDGLIIPDFFKDGFLNGETDREIIDRFLFGDRENKQNKRVRNIVSDEVVKEKVFPVQVVSDEIVTILDDTKSAFKQAIESVGGYYFEKSGHNNIVGSLDEEVLKHMQLNPPEVLKEALSGAALCLSESGVRDIFTTGENQTLGIVQTKEVVEIDGKIKLNLDVDYKPDIDDYSGGILFIKNIDTGEKISFYVEIIEKDGKMKVSCQKNKGNGIALDINTGTNSNNIDYLAYCTKMINAKTKKEALEFLEEMIVLGYFNNTLSTIFSKPIIE